MLEQTKDNTWPRINYVLMDGAGHQSDFDRVFECVFKETGLICHPAKLNWNTVFSADPLFHPWLDTHPLATFKALCVGMVRSLLGHKTIALFFRPLDCFHKGSLKASLRKQLFSFACRFSHFHLISIVPFDLCPEVSKVATGWIYDPQLWDLHYLDVPPLDNPALEEELRKQAKGRKIVVTLGRQDHTKGFDFFVKLWCSSQKLRESYLFVSAGKIAAHSQESADEFVRQGGYLINERIEDDVLFYLYDKADIVWSCYAPDYNQSSGIHGRALQLGRPVLVREGAILETLSAQKKHPFLSLPYDDPEESSSRLLNKLQKKSDGEEIERRVSEMRNQSLSVLKEALLW